MVLSLFGLYSFKTSGNIKAILPNGQSIIISINCEESTTQGFDANGYGTSGGKKYQYVKRTYRNENGGLTTIVNAKEVTSFPAGC